LSVEQKNIIDIISIDKNDCVVLTISDHLEWDEANEHLLILQDKINRYLGAIETGELYETYPKARGRQIIVRIVSLYSPSSDGLIFLEKTKNILESAGYKFHFEHKIAE